MGDQTKSMQKLSIERSIEHRKHNQINIKVITSVVPQKFPTRVFSQPYRKTLTQLRLRVENNYSLHKKGDPSSSSQHLTITLQLTNLFIITKPRSLCKSCYSCYLQSSFLEIGTVVCSGILKSCVCTPFYPNYAQDKL